MKQDQVVAEVRELLLKRSEFGIRKYGMTVDENLDSDFIQHAVEEVADTLVYLRAFQYQMRELCKVHPDDVELGGWIRRLYGNPDLGKVTSSPQNYPIGETDPLKYV